MKFPRIMVHHTVGLPFVTGEYGLPQPGTSDDLYSVWSEGLGEPGATTQV